MPTYSYTDNTGQTVTLNVPVDQRDQQPGLTRVAIITPSVHTQPALLPTDQKESIRKGYYKEECTKGSRFHSSFTKKQIRQAWGF